MRVDLLAWYHANRRRMPWREQPSLYRTVVSEFMLQQTQVKTVLPYFDRWMAALPDFKALAAADESRVLKLWEGLGYYSRARKLHQLAKALAALSSPPRDAASWREFPGVGPYTSAAITSIAFGTPAACVDGNVVRILARLGADKRSFANSAEAAKAFTPAAESLLNPKHPGDHNQAMMELGATLCTKSNPRCEACPLAWACEGRRLGIAPGLPRLSAKVIEQRHLLRAWCLHRGALLLHRVPDGGKRLAGQHELPSAEQLGLPAERLREGRLLAQRSRGITRFRFTEDIHELPTPPAPLREDLVRVPLEKLDDIVLSGPHRRWIKELLYASSGL